MYFKIISEISQSEVIAKGNGVQARKALDKKYGKGMWRKLKGTATVELQNGSIRIAEIHWYEARGIGKKEFKIKEFVD